MKVVSLPLLILSFAIVVFAEEGLWMYSQAPAAVIKQKHNFDLTADFLDHLRLSSVTIGGGSGAFVSPNGLLLTNHHLIANCLENLKDGYVAASQSEERPCSALSARVLLKTEDVTTQVKGTPAGQSLAGRNAAISRIEKDCESKGASCQVVRLFSGGRYDLYTYKTYSDIRLVFAPEEALAFFGRERDSITYLRYGLDIAFLRAYEDGKPAQTPHFLKWNDHELKDGSLVFSAAVPGATARATTAAQLTFIRDAQLPITIGRLSGRSKQLRAFASQSEENNKAAQAASTAFLETYKSAVGKLIGLRDDRLVGRKTNFDNKIRRAVEADSRLGKDAGKIWDDIAKAYKLWAPFEKAYQIVEAAPAPGSALFRIARKLVRGEPLAADADIAIHKGLESLLLAQYLEEIKTLAEKSDKEVPLKGLLHGKSTADDAEAMVKGTTLNDPAERRKLENDRTAITKSNDPLLKLALRLDEAAQKLRGKRAELIGSLEVSATEKIAQYRLQLFGAADYPDGTHTPRFTYGVVKGYTDRAGISQPHASTFGGLYYRRNNEGPYLVPQRWLDARSAINLIAPLDFVSTCDIGGGAAGSPTINTSGELVGIVFDGNLESLPATYLYSDDQARAVHVSSQGIAEALRRVYNATALLTEINAR
ncbi:MAG: S46 family peptidase [Acidobacteria bacterium]|nr:S46 family peptidase [Acidobacteriota bacterium]